MGEILSRYNLLKEAFEKNGLPDLFDDPEYSLNAFLKNHNRIREEFDKYGWGYFFDSVPAMRDFLAKYKDMEAELKAMKDANAGGKLAARDAEMARLDAQLRKREEEIEALKARLKEFEQLGDIEMLKKYKKDSEELRGLQRIYNQMSGRIAELERLLAEKEREREEALANERMMKMKYKELDIFKLDIIARELKGLDHELATVGSLAKSMNMESNRLKDYGDQQKIASESSNVLDQCKLLRAHIRDVIHKCLTETQKMHIGVAIDGCGAAGKLEDGGTMVVASYEEIERVDHGNSHAARLRQQDARAGRG